MTAPTKARREELRALAAAATPGPWEWRDGSGLRSMHDRGEFKYGPEVLGLGPDCDGDTTLSLASTDAKYIGAVSPDVLVALLDALDDAEANHAEAVNYPEIPEGSLAFHIGQLRHLWALMVAGCVTDTAEAARGLLGPAIEAIEKAVGR